MALDSNDLGHGDKGNIEVLAQALRESYSITWLKLNNNNLEGLYDNPLNNYDRGKRCAIW